MSKALDTFCKGIEDARSILSIYDCHNQNLDKIKELYSDKMPCIDVLKRACVVMAFTAFESFFENLVREINSKQIHDFSDEKKNKKLERFHNPTSQNIIELYRVWFGIDNCLKGVGFDGRDAQDICNQLDEFLNIRGQIVHVQKTDSSLQDVARRDNVVKIFGFIEKFAQNFDNYIESGTWIEELRSMNSNSTASDKSEGVSA